MTSSGKNRRGFASMDAEKQRAIASRGGKAAHEKGRAHKFSPEEARIAGRKGGLASRRGRAPIPAELMLLSESLSAFTFPASKEQILKQAGEAKIPTPHGSVALKQILERSSRHEFPSQAELTTELSKLVEAA